MSGLMQPGPTQYEAEQIRKSRGSQGLLGALGEPMSYAPGPVGLLGNAMMSAQYLTGEKPLDDGLSALAMMTGLLQGTKVAPILRGIRPFVFNEKEARKVMSEKKADEIYKTNLDNKSRTLFGHQGANGFDDLSERQKSIVSRYVKRPESIVSVSRQEQEKRYLKSLLEENPQIQKSAHKIRKLDFNEFPIEEFKKGVQFYKSPTYNGRQSSEYALVMIGDKPAYARKSNHWGDFFTNIRQGTEDARALGFGDYDEVDDVFGRVGLKSHQWNLHGGNKKSSSSAGFILLEDLEKLLGK